MTQRFNVGDRVQVKAANPGGTNRTPFFILGKKGVVVHCHGLAGNPKGLAYGGADEAKLPLYWVSFHMAHLFDEDPDFVGDRVLVDIWENWLEPVTQERVDSRPIDMGEHDLTYYERRAVALQGLLVRKGIVNTDEIRRLVAEFDFHKKELPHPMVPHPSHPPGASVPRASGRISTQLVDNSSSEGQPPPDTGPDL